MQRSSASTPPRQSSGVSREKLTAMLDVLKARWQTKGFHAMEKENSEPMALECIRDLDRHGIPYQHYRELYLRSKDLRSQRMAQGLNCDDFSTDMMIACWPALRKEISERGPKQLSPTAPSQCTRCYGTGLENVRNAEGRVIFVRSGCKHEVVEESEPNTEGIDAVIAAAAPGVRDESAIGILNSAWRKAHMESVTGMDDEACQRGRESKRIIERVIKRVKLSSIQAAEV
jgi:hypothetical protein